MPVTTATRTEPRRFVPENFDITDAASVEKLYGELEARQVSTREDLENFVLDWDELTIVLDESRVEAYINMTSDTTNPDYEARYTHISEQVLPVIEQRSFDLKQKLLDSPAVSQLDDSYFMFLRSIRSEVELFREENVPLQMKERELDQEFQKISGAQHAEFRGKTYTLPQLAPFLEEIDRRTREEAWRARSDARLADAAALDDLFDRMYDVRQRIARNAGFDNYLLYRFKELKRLDYTPQDCTNFHEAIEKRVVPVVTRDQERRKRLLSVDTLRPWDMAVDAEGNPPLHPFGNIDELKDGCERIFRRIDPELGDYFHSMVEEDLLDLENRPGKAPGGYMDVLAARRRPFIFMNAVGTKNDVETLLHEGGHSFHYFLARHLPLLNYQDRGIGSEFAEVGSMTMEYLCRPYLGEFYNPEEVKRLHDEKLRDSLRWFPFMAMIDAFQHWVYTAEEHGSEARKAKWAELEARFRPDLDWQGLEQHRDIGWQYLHVFSVPFYFIEYAIAQLAAMRIWLNSLEDERGAVEAYKRGLSLGASQPLPELFRAAGAEFRMDERTIGAIVEGTLAQLSAE